MVSRLAWNGTGLLTRYLYVEFRAWLDVQDPVLRHRSVLKAAPEHIGLDPEAGRWLLEHESLVAWMEKGVAPVWLYGKSVYP